MSEHRGVFTVHADGAAGPRNVTLNRLIIAGWTGRDKVALERHIAELAELGVPRPATTPTYYTVAARRLSTDSRIEVTGANTSGEVEFVLVRTEGRTFVGVGSDHTDRTVETYDITVSKQICDKPLAPVLWDFQDVSAHWDRLILRSWAWFEDQRTLYQEGSVAAMLAPHEIVRGAFGASGLPDGYAMYCGTLGARGGIRPASRFEFEIEDPILNRRLSHRYDIAVLDPRTIASDSRPAGFR